MNLKGGVIGALLAILIAVSTVIILELSSSTAIIVGMTCGSICTTIGLNW